MVTNEEIRKARAFIYGKGFNANEIQPRLFALTAKKTGKQFSEVLELIAFLQMRGQGLGASPKGQRFVQ